MALVEGIGDEVLFSFILGFLFIVFLIGWVSDFFRNFSLLSPNTDHEANDTQPENAINESNNHSDDYSPVSSRDITVDNTNETFEELQELESSASSTPEPNQNINETLEPSSHSGIECLSTDSDTLQGEATPGNLEPSADDPEALRLKRLEFFNQKPEKATSTSKVEGKVKVETTQPVGNGHILNPATRDRNENNDIPVNSTETAQGYFNIRLKSLDDTERLVRGKADQLIRAFKREYFAADVASNKTVRLIYNGQVLQDQQTLEAYHIQEGCVVHVQISSINLNTPSNHNQSDSELDLGQFFWPLLGVLLGIVWMLYFQYKEHFNTSSTVALLGLSGLFLTIVWGQYARPPEQG